MSKPNHNHTESPTAFAHAALVERLLGEAFAIENRLADHTLEQVGEHLEAAKLAFDAQTAPLTTLQAALKESFERCHSVYCELLFELDMVPAPEVTSKTLWELSQHERVTQMIQIPRPAPAPQATEAEVDKDEVTGDLPPLWNQMDMVEAADARPATDEPGETPSPEAVEALWQDEAHAQSANAPSPASQELPLPEPIWPEQTETPDPNDGFNDQPEISPPSEDLPLPEAFPTDDSLPSEGEIKLDPDFEAEPASKEEVSALNSLESLESDSAQWQDEVKLEEQTKSFARKLFEPPKPEEVLSMEEEEKIDNMLQSADGLADADPFSQAPAGEENELQVSQAVEWEEEPKAENKALDDLFAEADRKRAAEAAQAQAAEAEAMAPLEASLTEGEPAVAVEASYNEARSAPALRDIPEEEVAKPHYNDYWTTAEWFGSMETALPSPISKLARKRLATLLMTLSVEHQLANLMHPVLHQAWPSRRDWLRLLAKGPLPLKEIPPEIKAEVNAVAQQRLDLIHEKRFPHPGIVNSINYFLDVEFDKLRPTLLDHGTLVLFFGFHRQWAGTQFPNILSLAGIDENEVTELSFRLFRLHKLRNKALAMGEPFDSEAFELAKTDAERIHALLAKIAQQPDASQAQQVA